MKTTANPNDIFFLAREVHNVLNPLIRAAQQYEPTIRLDIELRFDAPAGNNVLDNAVFVMAYWGRDGMFFNSMAIRESSDIAAYAAKVQAFIDAEQAKIEERHDLEAFYGVAEDVEAEARDWETRQDRLRERADIERDEDAHDIELQNVAAGN